MFGGFFNQQTLSRISGWFCALLVVTLLIHPFNLSAEQLLWQSNDSTFSSPTCVIDLVATPVQTHDLDKTLLGFLPLEPAPGISLPEPDQRAAAAPWSAATVLPHSALRSSPASPRPPPCAA